MKKSRRWSNVLKTSRRWTNVLKTSLYLHCKFEKNTMLMSYNYIDWPIVSAKFMLITIMFTKLKFLVICAQYLVYIDTLLLDFDVTVTLKSISLLNWYTLLKMDKQGRCAVCSFQLGLVSI